MDRILKLKNNLEIQKPFFNKTIVISGASRGIGFAIAKKLAQDGANIVILAKTTTKHPKLPGTIFTAAEEIEKLGGNALPIKCDIRFEGQIQSAVKKIIKKYKKIDILINNASAINLSNIEQLSMKKGCFLLTKCCLPFLKKSGNGQILNISPPLNLDKKWFKEHEAYSISKIGMSMCALGWSGEFKKYKISVNCLWPQKFIFTSAVKYVVGGPELEKRSRKPQIMADSAYLLLSQQNGKQTGNFFTDKQILELNGIKDFIKYRINPNCSEEELIDDGFLQLNLIIYN